MSPPRQLEPTVCGGCIPLAAQKLEILETVRKEGRNAIREILEEATRCAEQASESQQQTRILEEETRHLTAEVRGLTAEVRKLTNEYREMVGAQTERMRQGSELFTRHEAIFTENGLTPKSDVDARLRRLEHVAPAGAEAMGILDQNGITAKTNLTATVRDMEPPGRAWAPLVIAAFLAAAIPTVFSMIHTATQIKKAIEHPKENAIHAHGDDVSPHVR